jgi:hypothetical protein
MSECHFLIWACVIRTQHVCGRTVHRIEDLEGVEFDFEHIEFEYIMGHLAG